MGRVKPVLDTNILIDYLGGVAAAREEVGRFPGAYISTIAWIEVMAGTKDAADELAVRRFLQHFERVPVDADIAELSFHVRRQHRVKLPDAIIWATAKRKNTLLVTRNVRDFPEHEPDIRIPYRL
jgi:predicted nucleic acid-binding protein